MNLREAIEEKLKQLKSNYKPQEVEINTEQLSLNTFIEHTNLKPTATTEEIEKLCEEAKLFGFRGVCVNPTFVPLVAEKLRNTGILVVTVIGFPLGATGTPVKAFEANWVVQNGAQEVDMVINIGKLKEGDYQYVYDDIRAVVEASKVPVKVIIETCYLTNEEKVAACVISKLAGAKFVKTSTGFGTGGAKFEDVQLMRWAVDGEIEVKASGGIRTYEDAIKMLKAGATRIGTSSGVAICSTPLNG
uniref:Deoxyribose-phosphate aldolase n=1 Tax=Fervidobacterium thailandense TaxID=1008305 RepID=A0A7C4VTZ0_9BACT